MVTVKDPSATTLAARTAVILFLFVIVFTAVLAAIYALTRPGIEASAAEEKQRSIGEVLPQALYDNNLLQDETQIPPTPELGQDDNSLVYRARLQGQPAALVMEAVAPDGYAGKIRMLVAVKADGELAGVRVTEYKETPGWGITSTPRRTTSTRITPGSNNSPVFPSPGWRKRIGR